MDQTPTSEDTTKTSSTQSTKLKDTHQLDRSNSGHNLCLSRKSSLADHELHEKPKLTKRLSEADRLKKVLDRSFKLLYGDEPHHSGSVDEDFDDEHNISSHSSSVGEQHSSDTLDKKEELLDTDEIQVTAKLISLNVDDIFERDQVVKTLFDGDTPDDHDLVTLKDLGLEDPDHSNNSNSTDSSSSQKNGRKSITFDDNEIHGNLDGNTSLDGVCEDKHLVPLATSSPLSKMREHVRKLQAGRFTPESKRSKSSSDVTTKTSVLVRIVAETRRLEKEIKAKSDEVDELKEQISQQQADKEKLRKQLDEVGNNQSDTSRKLVRSQDIAEKLRLENKKKSEHVEKLERNISHMEDRIRNLEIRASEVDKAEITLESTKRNLEASQLECRAKEKEIEREREKHDNVCKDLQMATSKIESLEKKLEDLKIQVRYELMKNENIERGLETIPRLKEDIEERDKKISELQKDVEDKAVLLNASRKAAREYKEKLRDLERQDVEAIVIKEELEIAKSEVDTLKRLMSGKDVLLLQKCQSLDQAKSVVTDLRSVATSDGEKLRLRQIQHVLDQLRQIHNDTSPPDNRLSSSQKPAPHNRFAQSRPRSAMSETNRGGIDVNNHPYPPETNSNGQHNNTDRIEADGKENTNLDNNQSKSSTYIFLERFLDDTEGLSNKQKRAKTAQPVSSDGGSPRVHRSSSFHQIHTNSSSNANGSLPHPGAKNGELLNRKRATSSHNIHHTPHASSTSPRSKKTTTTTTTVFVHATPPNLYTSEKNTKQLQYQPSLEYSLGVSTDEDLTTDTSHCHSGRHKASDSAQQNGDHSGKPMSRPRSAFVVSKRGHSTGSDSESGSHDAYGDGVGGKFTNQQLLTLSRLSGSEKDSILDMVIQTGDRISIKVNQKPPRYGRKKPKPVTYTGIVKYKGLLDSEHFDARIYVGIRLDAPLGDTDGMYKGKRYMFAPKNQAKFFKIRDLDTVLDVVSSVYVSTSRLILRYLDHRHYHDAINNPQTTAAPVSTNHHNNNNNSFSTTQQEGIYINGAV